MGAGVRIETDIMPATGVAGAAAIGLAWKPREAMRGVPWTEALPSVATTTGITSRDDVVTRGRVSAAGTRALLPALLPTLLILVGAFGSPLPGISIIPPASGASFDAAAVRLGVIAIATLGAGAMGFAAFASPGPGITIKPLVSTEEEDASAASAWASSACAAARMAASAAWAAAA